MTRYALPERPPAVQLWSGLDRVYTMLSRNLSAELAQFDLTTPQFRVLRQIADQPRSSGDVAERIGVTAGNLTGIVDRLEQDGLLSRERGDDRRSVQLTLTPAGGALLQQAVPHMHRHLQGVFSPLDADELGHALELLARLETHLSAPPRPEAEAVTGAEPVAGAEVSA